MAIASVSLCRKTGRILYAIVSFQRLRTVSFILFLVSSIFFFIFYFNLSTGAGELGTLRQQFYSQSYHLERLQNEIIDINIRMQSLKNSETECRANLLSLQQKLKFDDHNNENRFSYDQPQNHVQVVQPFREGDTIVQSKKAVRPIHTNGAGIYPILTSEGNFVPTKLWVHFDLKGAPFKISYFIELLYFVKQLGINGILIEWEDMFPYTGKLAAAVNGDAYSMEEIEQILKNAKGLGLEVIPLVQTFGHLEWVLKLSEFAHLREDPKFPQVICFGASESWELITDMVTQVADVHQRFGMNYLHMGADEVFQVGVCNESVREMKRQRGKERAILWHMGRVASFVRDKYSVTVLAWHDMLVTITEKDLEDYKLTDKLEPVLWSYAEDLNMFLPYAHWMALKPFRNVWGASAFKGADGPMRFYTNPVHYIRNHESWIEQMTRVHKEFDQFRGLVITGWSRYDHLAVLCELFPVAIPSLAMSVETILAGRPLNGRYDKTKQLLECHTPINPGYTYGCNFPGKQIYELVNEYAAQSQQLHKYLDNDFDLNGWLSYLAEQKLFSSPFYIEKVLPYLDFYFLPLERIERDLRLELNKYFFAEVADEFVLTYMGRDLALLRGRKRAAERILKMDTFQKRPFIGVKSNNSSQL